MSIYRHQLWTDVAAVDEHLTVFLKLDEVLESLLGDFGFVIAPALQDQHGWWSG